MELYDHIRKISFIFFIITGLLHFIAGLFFINGYFAPTTGLINRILFIPFALSTLTYGLSALKYNLASYGKDINWHTYVFLALGLVVFLTLLFIELFIQDTQIPLMPKA